MICQVKFGCNLELGIVKLHKQSKIILGKVNLEVVKADPAGELMCFSDFHVLTESYNV